MQTQNLTKLQQAGAVVTIDVVSREELILSIAKALEAMPDQKLSTMIAVEWGPLWWLRCKLTHNTVLDPIVEILNRRPGLSKLWPFVGAVMDTLDLSRAELNKVVCYCQDERHEASTHVIAARLRRLVPVA